MFHTVLPITAPPTTQRPAYPSRVMSPALFTAASIPLLLPRLVVEDLEPALRPALLASFFFLESRGSEVILQPTCLSHVLRINTIDY